MHRGVTLAHPNGADAVFTDTKNMSTVRCNAVVSRVAMFRESPDRKAVPPDAALALSDSDRAWNAVSEKYQLQSPHPHMGEKGLQPAKGRIG